MAMKKDGESRAQQVEPGHLPVSEWAGIYAGNQPPFGDDASHVPMKIKDLNYEHPPTPKPRDLVEEHRLAEDEYYETHGDD